MEINVESFRSHLFCRVFNCDFIYI